MELVMIFVAIMVVVLFVVITTIYMKRKNERQKKRYSAAAKIINEDLLNYSIRNSVVNQQEEPSSGRLMICLNQLHTKGKEAYVFDPGKIVYIGRSNPEGKNMVCLNDIEVSKEHCMIYEAQNGIYLKDLNSSNGTRVKRGLRNYYLTNGEAMELLHKDRLYIGSYQMKVDIFYYDIFVG